MKGLILAAGLGTRLRPITSLRPKPTIKVANRPLIYYAVDNLVGVGIRDIGIVVSYDTINSLKATLEHYGVVWDQLGQLEAKEGVLFAMKSCLSNQIGHMSKRPKQFMLNRGDSYGGDVTFEYLLQNPPQGLAHAVKVSRAFLGDDPFVMYLSDNLFEFGISDVVAAFDPDAGTNAALALVPVDDPRAFGVAEIENGRITRLVEKPSEPKSNLAVAGVYVFDRSIHDMIADLEPGAKGEYQITDAIQKLIVNGYHVTPTKVRGWWKDTGKAEDILDANRLELLKLRRDVRGELHGAEIVGDVIIEDGALVRDTTIFGPALIGTGAQLENVYIGPFTTIGNNVVIRNAELEYSVVGDHTHIEGIKPRIQASLIGEDVHIVGHSGRPSTHRLIIGDKSRVVLQEI